MSSSSLYEPEESEDASDSDFDTGAAPRTKAPPSSPPLEELHQDGQSSSVPISRSHIGTRSQALERLRFSLAKESVEEYGNLLETSPTATDDPNFRQTEHGIVSWLPREKKVFFETLDRKGKNGVREIAQAIGTKSELEVQEFLGLLHEGLIERHTVKRHVKSVILKEIPAAAEISRKCCRALDEYAELLQIEEQHTEDVAGRQRHHDMWIVDHDVAAELDEQIQPQDESFVPATSIQHTAGLLNVKSWIRLSERFFMNFGGPRLEDNWVNVAFADETPSVTADAFADFYALAVSVTRRLIHSALFFAMSRLHSMRDTGNSKAQVVKSRDVRTALDVLNMKHDRFDYWVGLARRCHLEVADLRHRKGWNSVRMDYNEVEDILSDRVPLDPEPGGRSVSRHEAQDEENDESDSAISSDLSSPLSEAEEPLPIDLEDYHAEIADQNVSHLKEQQLWAMLGQSLPAPLHSRIVRAQRQAAQLPKPIRKRKSPEELVEWRNRTLYGEEWEAHGNGVFDIYEDISEHRRKRRRLEKPAMLLDALDSSSDEKFESDSDPHAANDDMEDVQNQPDALEDSSVASSANSNADEADDMEVDGSHSVSGYHPSHSPQYQNQVLPPTPNNEDFLSAQNQDLKPDLSTLQHTFRDRY